MAGVPGRFWKRSLIGGGSWAKVDGLGVGVDGWKVGGLRTVLGTGVALGVGLIKGFVRACSADIAKDFAAFFVDGAGEAPFVAVNWRKGVLPGIEKGKDGVFNGVATALGFECKFSFPNASL